MKAAKDKVTLVIQKKKNNLLWVCPAAAVQCSAVDGDSRVDQPVIKIFDFGSSHAHLDVYTVKTMKDPVVVQNIN